MDVQTKETEKGLQIDVYTDKKVAVVVQGREERIYLPESSENNSSYYSEDYEGLRETSFGYRLRHAGNISDFKVLG